MSKVAKSLSDLDALADEVLSKSVKEDKEDLKPEEISENVPDDTSKDAPENDVPAADTPEDDAVEDTADDKKETEEGAEEEDLEKCDTPDDVKKSDESEPVSEEDDKTEPEEEEDLEKGEDLEEEEDLEKGEDLEEEEDAKSKEELEKSIHSDFISDEEIKKGIDASEFLSSVVEILSKSLADAVGEIQLNRVDSTQNTSVLAKSLQATLSLNKSMAEEIAGLKKENESLKKSIADGFTEIKDSLEEVLSQPVGMRKSVKNIQVMDRNFQKSLNGDAVTGIENLSKSQVMDILVSEMRAGNQSVTASDIVSYESGAPLHAGLVALVNSKCR